VAGDLNVVVAGLVKIHTGFGQVSAAGYLKQAEEIFAPGNVATEGVSHPEAFIRARALSLWEQDPGTVRSQLFSMIEGAVILDDLDLLGQARLAGTTRRVLERLLRPKWFQTPAVLAHARQFFPDFSTTPPVSPVAPQEVRFNDPKMREYFCYVLLDFATADPSLDDLPLAAALQASQELGLEVELEKLVGDELKIKTRTLRKLKDQAAQMLAKAEVSSE